MSIYVLKWSLVKKVLRVVENSSTSFLWSWEVHYINLLPRVRGHVIESMELIVAEWCNPVNGLLSVELVSFVLLQVKLVWLIVLIEASEVLWILWIFGISKVVIKLTELLGNISFLGFSVATCIRVEFCSSLFEIKGDCGLMTFCDDFFNTAFSIRARNVSLTN